MLNSSNSLLLSIFLWCVCFASKIFADNVEECELFLAPSLTPGLGRGVFAGYFIPSGTIVEASATVKVPSVPLWQMDDYSWHTEDNNTVSLEFGAGSFLNHQNPSTVYHSFSEHTSQSVNQNLAHTTYVTAPMIANRDILPGEEISISYGETNHWLEDRGIVIKEVTNASSSVRSMEDLKENGHCITQVKVAKSTLPYAGRGLFASRDFAKDEIVSISPVLLLPKDEVAELGSYSDSVLQNYCIASPDSNVVLLPLGLGALANHAMAAMANIELEIFWWHSTDDIDKMRKLNSTLIELSQERFAQLDIAYRATRDIHEGEEVTYDYGEGWINSWATHLAEVNDWLIETAADTMAKMKGEFEEVPIERPRFLSFIEAPKNLYRENWKDITNRLEVVDEGESGSVAVESIEADFIPIKSELIEVELVSIGDSIVF